MKPSILRSGSFVALLVGLLLAGCSTSPIEVDRAKKRSADELVKKADAAMTRAEWGAAVDGYGAALPTYDELGMTYGVRGEGARIRAKYAHALRGLGRCAQASRELRGAVEIILSNNSIDITGDRTYQAGEFIKGPVYGAATEPIVCLKVGDKTFEEEGWAAVAVHRGGAEAASLASERAREQNARESADRAREARAERAATMAAVAGAVNTVAAQRAAVPPSSTGVAMAGTSSSSARCACGPSYVQCLAGEATRTGLRHKVAADGRSINYLRPDGQFATMRGWTRDGSCF